MIRPLSKVTTLSQINRLGGSNALAATRCHEAVSIQATSEVIRLMPLLHHGR